ncbi:alanine:cation symporter family protein [Vibrio sp.]|nr:alanine:cation symporter family protein [Vibrio sp.]
MSEILYIFADLYWGGWLIYALVGTGAYFTYKLDFIQFRYFKHSFFVITARSQRKGKTISSFQALCTGLAARIGIGNIVGVGLAISVGGPGAAFWMWMTALLGMATSFAESTLAQLFKTQDEAGYFRGGPAYYIQRGLGMKKMGMLFSFILIITFGFVFNAVQSNALSLAVEESFNLHPLYMMLPLSIFTMYVVFGGLKRIVKWLEIIVPIMALAYLSVALYIIFIHIEQVPSVFLLIIRAAFGLEEMFAGAVGYGIAQTLVHGIKRGLFSNEAGIGSTPNAAATAKAFPPHPVSQGYVQMLGVFIDTIVICTATVFIILLSDVHMLNHGALSSVMTQQAIIRELGDVGGYFVMTALFVFAFTSIIANYSYAETNIMILTKNTTLPLSFVRWGVILSVGAGAFMTLPTVWALVDVFMGLMATMNFAALLLLSPVIIKLTKDYNRQLKIGKLPVFKIRDFPELKNQIDHEVWGEKNPHL